jgi:hypothetical protein
MRIKQYKDITGQKFGKLTILKYVKTVNKRPYWECKCECGNIKIIRGKEIKSGLIKSCGCLLHNPILRNNLIGKRFNFLIVLDRDKTNKNSVFYKCKCDCGKETTVSSWKLISSHTKSCGCLRSEVSSENDLKRNKIMVGKNHPRWRFDLTNEDREENSNRNYNPKSWRWRNKVYKRDNFTCQKCGDNKGGNLIAHHMYSWNDHPKLRYVKNNGITLCENCHKKFHHIYGYGYNNKKQFKEWIIYE